MLIDGSAVESEPLALAHDEGGGRGALPPLAVGLAATAAELPMKAPRKLSKRFMLLLLLLLLAGEVGALLSAT